MRHALSLLAAIAVALAVVLLLHHVSSLSLFALTGIGIGTGLLLRTWAFNLPVLRRASVRLRIFCRRHGGAVLPVSPEAGPFMRRQIGRVNLMWLSYALIAGWASYEMVSDSSFASAPIQRAAAGASSAMDAVAGTSAAIRALSAVGEDRQHDLAAGISAAALPKGSEVDRVMLKTESGDSPVMGAAAKGEPRTGDSGCNTSSMLEVFLPEPPVKEF